MSQTRSDEVSRIVQALATLPGSLAMNVVARKYPRFGPGEPGRGFQQQSRSFGTDEVPEGLGLPADVEEVIITLKGTLPEPQAKDELVDQINEFFSDPDVAAYWDIRARFTQPNADYSQYELTIFRNPMA